MKQQLKWTANQSWSQSAVSVPAVWSSVSPPHRWGPGWGSTAPSTSCWCPSCSASFHSLRGTAWWGWTLLQHSQAEPDNMFRSGLQQNLTTMRRLMKTGQSCFTSDWCPVHDLILCYGVVLVVHVRTCAGCLPLDDVNLHMFDLNPHQQKVNLPYNHIFKVIPASKWYDPSHSIFWREKVW